MRIGQGPSGVVPFERRLIVADDDLKVPDEEATSSKRANAVDGQIGNRVRLRRMLVGMSQERLGELLKVTFQQIQKYERGTNRISASRLFQVSKVLGVTIDYFYDALQVADDIAETPGFAEHTSEEAEMLTFLSTREGIELNRAFQRIVDPAKRRAVVELVRTMAGDKIDT
jgi:transcriptional regulator with XRE-family HTH domain